LMFRHILSPGILRLAALDYQAAVRVPQLSGLSKAGRGAILARTQILASGPMDTWTPGWWLWLILGLVLVGLELTTPAELYLLFFGVAAIVVGVVSAVGPAQPLWLQVLLFSVLSVAALGLFRRSLLARLRSRGPERVVDGLVGETALALEDLPVNGVGKVELRASSWQARNVGKNDLSAGQRCTVEWVDGLMLGVRGSWARERLETPFEAREERELT
jgi:inner membrane protein